MTNLKMNRMQHEMNLVTKCLFRFDKMWRALHKLTNNHFHSSTRTKNHILLLTFSGHKVSSQYPKVDLLSYQQANYPNLLLNIPQYHFVFLCLLPTILEQSILNVSWNLIQPSTHGDCMKFSNRKYMFLLLWDRSISQITSFFIQILSLNILSLSPSQ